METAVASPQYNGIGTPHAEPSQFSPRGDVINIPPMEPMHGIFDDPFTVSNAGIQFPKEPGALVQYITTLNNNIHRQQAILHEAIAALNEALQIESIVAETRNTQIRSRG
jgi:hypothetical protein